MLLRETRRLWKMQRPYLDKFAWSEQDAPGNLNTAYFRAIKFSWQITAMQCNAKKKKNIFP